MSHQYRCVLRQQLSYPAHRINSVPIESSKVIGLDPTDGSIIVTSNRDANNRKSSLSPRKPCGWKTRRKIFRTSISPHLQLCLVGWRICPGSSFVCLILYILPLGQIMNNFKGISRHCYADDIQLYVLFKLQNAVYFIWLPKLN